MLARLERGERRLQMVIDMGDDRDQIDLGVVEELTVIGVGPGHAVLPGHLVEPFRPTRADGRELGLGELFQGVNVVFAEPAEPDHATTYSVHGKQPLEFRPARGRDRPAR
jgi:hypothetical protein